jgi:hypothetical protein
MPVAASVVAVAVIRVRPLALAGNDDFCAGAWSIQPAAAHRPDLR